MPFVKPAPGALVRDPATMAPVPPEGRAVPETAHWRRQIMAGDLIETSPTAAKPRAKKEG